MKTFLLNIGNADKISLTELYATVRRIETNMGVTMFVYDRVTNPKTDEPTWVCRIRGKNVDNRLIYKLSEALGEDCIAVYDELADIGCLIGPKADKWGKFDPDLFLKGY